MSLNQEQKTIPYRKLSEIDSSAVSQKSKAWLTEKVLIHVQGNILPNLKNIEIYIWE